MLRSHGPSVWPDYRALNGTLRMPCMHGGGLVASSSSTAGWVADLATETHWITGTSAQCLSLFKPTRVGEPVHIGTIPDRIPDTESLWWRHERLARSVMRDPDTLARLFTRDRDEIEHLWWSDPPAGQEAFDRGSEALDEWADLIGDASVAGDVRPWYARRYWAKRQADAPLP